jgi:hypothetical protein
VVAVAPGPGGRVPAAMRALLKSPRPNGRVLALRSRTCNGEMPPRGWDAGGPIVHAPVTGIAPVGVADVVAAVTGGPPAAAEGTTEGSSRGAGPL